MALETAQVLQLVLDHHRQLVAPMLDRHNTDLVPHHKTQIVRDNMTIRFDLGDASDQELVVGRFVNLEHDLVIRCTASINGQTDKHIIHVRELVRGMERRSYKRVWVINASWYRDSSSHLPELICNTALDLRDIKVWDLPTLIFLG